MTASVTFTNTSNWEEALYILRPREYYHPIVKRSYGGLSNLESGKRLVLVERQFCGEDNPALAGEITFIERDNAAWLDCQVFYRSSADIFVRTYHFSDMRSYELKKAIEFVTFAAKCDIYRIKRKESIKIGDPEDLDGVVMWVEPPVRKEYLGEVGVKAYDLKE